ncbi:MAG TPA: hypothetical protein VEF34_10800 [Syntrophobacteraceae bacterium]|nr:hypothetical protein [Syntrophobacteraceae bacterium]
MEEYARRGVFRGFSLQRVRGASLAFRMTWHRDLVFDIIVDTAKKTISLPKVLPHVPPALYADFKRFVAAHHDAGLPEHRRIVPAKSRLRCSNHRGRVALTIAVKDGDYKYALQRLIHLVHETFLIFLLDGAYRDYRVEQLGDDPDWG